jgi:hypothetical protein
MSRGELDWFQLRFPHDLSTDAAIAALSVFSGIPSRTRIVLDLDADHLGISHRLAVSPRENELATADLRAAIPSLRLEPVAAPKRLGRSLLMQMAPGTGALRTDDLAAGAAALLSSLFPLAEGETIRMRWTLRSAPLPALPAGRYEARDGRERVVRAKLAEPGGHYDHSISVSRSRR